MEGYQFPFDVTQVTGLELYDHICDLMNQHITSSWIIIRSVDEIMEEGEIRDDEIAENYPDTDIRFEWPEIPYGTMSTLWHFFVLYDCYFVASLIGPAEWEDCTTRYGRGWTLMIKWSDQFLWERDYE